MAPSDIVDIATFGTLSTNGGERADSCDISRVYSRFNENTNNETPAYHEAPELYTVNAFNGVRCF